MNRQIPSLPKPNKFSVEKMQNLYIANLEGLVKTLAEIVVLLSDQQAIQSSSINELNQLYTELKYTEKMKAQPEYQSKQLNKYVENAINILRTKNQQFPRIRQMKSQNQSQLATISEKYSEQNILSHYLRKNSHQNRKNKNLNNNSQLEFYSETLHLGSQVNRQQTRRSLDSSREEKQKKPLYKELEKIKPKDQLATYRIYQQPKKHNVKSRLPTYTISKFI